MILLNIAASALANYSVFAPKPPTRNGVNTRILSSASPVTFAHACCAPVCACVGAHNYMSSYIIDAVALNGSMQA